MEKKENKNRELLQRYLENRCTPREWETVVQLLADDSSAREILLELQSSFKNIETASPELNEARSTRIRNELMQKISVGQVVHFRNRSLRLAMAAAAVAAVFVGLYFLYGHYSPNPISRTLAHSDKPVTKPVDVDPGGNKAVLTLSNGGAIVLDDTKNGSLPAQGNTSLLKGNGTLNYQSTGKPAPELLYNMLSTPRGGQYQVTLPDGTRVWLNAASSLRYPTAFAGDNRRVEMTGEAYFEVVKNDQMPFLVNVNGAEVQVLGTHFNVMAYKDESALKTTLLEGSVKFSYQQNTTYLKPGQQSLLSGSGELKRVESVDVDKVVAWKNGSFDFDGADIGTVLRQLSRWYSVEVNDKNPSEEVFYATIPRSMKLSEVLKALEMTDKIHFEIKEGRIIVKE